jgi:predicted permease
MKQEPPDCSEFGIALPCAFFTIVGVRNSRDMHVLWTLTLGGVVSGTVWGGSFVLNRLSNSPIRRNIEFT